MKKLIASTVGLTMVTLLSPLVWAQDDKAPVPAVKTQAVSLPHDTPHWDYQGARGPHFWGKLDPDFSLCEKGHNQSPIDIAKTSPATLPKLQADFSPAKLQIVHHEHIADEINNGHAIQVNYSEGDTLTIGDTTYELIQFHFHSPSEHTVKGMYYPMEMHFVHKSASGALAVVGVFIERGAHNAAFDPIWANLPKQKGVVSRYEHVQVNVDDLLPHITKSYRYDGSLTTPPCSEGVKWIVMQSPIQLSAAQIKKFTSLITANNRPVQPLHHHVTVSDAVAEEVVAKWRSEVGSWTRQQEQWVSDHGFVRPSGVGFLLDSPLGLRYQISDCVWTCHVRRLTIDPAGQSLHDCHLLLARLRKPALVTITSILAKIVEGILSCVSDHMKLPLLWPSGTPFALTEEGWEDCRTRIRVELAFASSEKPQHGLTRRCDAFRNLIRESTYLPCCLIHCNARHVESHQPCAVLSQKLNAIGSSGKINLVQASTSKTPANA